MRYFVEENGVKTYFTFDLLGFKNAQALCERLCNKYKVDHWEIQIEEKE